MDTFQPIFDLLSAKQGWLPAVLGWLGSVRLLVKPAGAKLQTVLLAMLVKAKDTTDPRDDEVVTKILNSTWYGWLSFLCDWLLSTKLPARKDWDAMKPSQPTIIGPPCTE